MARKMTVSELKRIFLEELGEPTNPQNLKIKSKPWDQGEPEDKIEWPKALKMKESNSRLSIKQFYTHLTEAAFVVGGVGAGMPKPQLFAGPSGNVKDRVPLAKAQQFATEEEAQQAADALNAQVDQLGYDDGSYSFQVFPANANMGPRPSYPQ